MYDFALIDGKNLLYRVQWVFRNMKTSAGVSTGMLFGTLNSLSHLKEMFFVRRFVFLWDSLSNWRVNKYPWYKSGRKDKPPEDFISQQGEIQKKLLPALGIDQIELLDYEADDLAGWFVQRYISNPDCKILLISGDHDWLQLVGESSHLYRTSDSLLYSSGQNVKVAFGLLPGALPFYWSIVGDSTDQVPGIKGFRKKRAIQIASEMFLHGRTWTDFPDLKDSADQLRINHSLIRLTGNLSGSIRALRSTKNLDLLEELFTVFEFQKARTLQWRGLLC